MFRFTQIPRRLPPPSFGGRAGTTGGSCRGACRKAKPKINGLAVVLPRAAGRVWSHSPAVHAHRLTFSA